MLQRLKLCNFRSYVEGEFEFSPEVTIITGKNGAGKTNILESVYVLLNGGSFKDGDELLTHYAKDWWKVLGLFDGLTREIRYQPDVNGKHVFLEGVDKGRFTYKHQLPVVLFEPEHLMLIHGPPALRRLYIDNLLMHTNPTYRKVLAKYGRALQQRNNLLKKGYPTDNLKDSIFVWDIALAEYGSTIRTARETLVVSINKKINDTYRKLATKNHDTAVVYVHDGSRSAQEISKKLEQSLEKDITRGFTSIGPHRDDMGFLLDGKDSKTTASRGEVRTIVLALKHIELMQLSDSYGQMPLFLLDDVFSELDEIRQKALLVATEGVQKIITTTYHQKTTKQNGLKIIHM